MGDPVTWEELADIYAKKTGGRARIQPMDTIFNWAAAQTDLFVVSDDGSLHHKEKACIPTCLSDYEHAEGCPKF